MSDNYLLSKHILIVDDEQELLNMVSSILNEYGFQHITTAESAVRLWRRPSVIRLNWRYWM